MQQEILGKVRLEPHFKLTGGKHEGGIPDWEHPDVCAEKISVTS